MVLKSYIEILRETYLVLPVSPFFRNKNREISKAPRVYFIDPAGQDSTPIDITDPLI
ncbi:MAG: hypothetical protein HY721_19650 [Planctomycetes bacterium]|nr:hypothetical protein [Planctomycetota bacterium]